jgi:N-acetylglucosamine-6-sulfatase
VLNDRAVKFVRVPRAKPFCLYLAHKALHPELVQYDDGSVSDISGSRFLPAKRHENLYTSAAIPRRLGVTDSLESKPALRRIVEGKAPLSGETGTDDETIRDRLRMLAAVDEGVGQLFDALEETDQLNDTVIVLTSDHGYWNGEHRLSVERRLAYEEAIRIPLLVRYPPLVQPGTIIDDLALSIDLAPTILDLAGVNTQNEMDGRSLVPLLAGQRPHNWRESFLIEYYSDVVFPHVRNMGYKAVRTRNHKYIHYTDLKGMDKLYDLREDPYEMHNVIDHPDLVYDDGPPQRMGKKPPEPRYQFDPGKAAKWPSHMEDFLQCVRTREKPRCDEDEAFIETATLMMSVESYNQKRQVRWDAKHETIV